MKKLTAEKCRLWLDLFEWMIDEGCQLTLELKKERDHYLNFLEQQKSEGAENGREV